MCTSCVRKGAGCENADKHYRDWLYGYISEDMYLSLHGFTRWRKQGNPDAEPVDLATINWDIPERSAEGEVTGGLGNEEKEEEHGRNNESRDEDDEDEEDEDEDDDSDDDDDDGEEY